MNELQRLLILSGQREEYSHVLEGVILHVRKDKKEIMNLRLEGMRGMSPIVSTLRANGYDDLEFSDRDNDHAKVDIDMAFDDDEDGDMSFGGDDEGVENPVSAAQEAAGKFSAMEIDADSLPEDMAEKLSHLTVCLNDVYNVLGGGEEDMDAANDEPSMDMDGDELSLDDEPSMEGIALQGHPYHDKSDAELRYIIKDAGEAAKNMKGMDDKAEAKYLDQVNDASTVLYSRRPKKGELEEKSLGAFTSKADNKKVDETKKGRDNDTKHTGGLSKNVNKAELKALKAKERQAGKKEANGGVEEAAVNVTVFDNSAMPADAVDDQKQKDERTGRDTRTNTKNKVPKDVMAAIDKRISELNKSIDRYGNKGYNEKSMKDNAIDCLEQIKTNLKRGDLEGFMEAQIFFGTLMSPIINLFPAQLVNYIAKGSDE